MENPSITDISQPKKTTNGDRYAEFEYLARELAEKELELSTLEKKLSIFEGKYARTIGVLLAELDEIEQEIAKNILRIHSNEESRQGFQRAERKAKASRDAVDEKLAQDDKKPFIPSDELKNLFRKVAKIIHPDLATNQQEREIRNTMMTRANEAYKMGDVEGLNQILEAWEQKDDESFSKHTELSPSDQLEQKILQIKTRIKEINKRISELMKSELCHLMIKVEDAEARGHDLLSAMAKNLQDQIIAANKLLVSLQQKE